MACIRFTTERPNESLAQLFKCLLVFFVAIPVGVSICCCAGLGCYFYSLQADRQPRQQFQEFPPPAFVGHPRGVYPQGQNGGLPVYNTAYPPQQQFNQPPPNGSPQPASVPPLSTAPLPTQPQPAV